jgi:hypothetical protein
MGGREIRQAAGTSRRSGAPRRQRDRCHRGTVSVLSARATTTTIPIVFSTGTDPVRLGLVASLNRPGGNLTGVMLLVSELGGKLLGLLREIVPTGTLIAVLLSPDNPTAEYELNYIQQAARNIKQEIPHFARTQWTRDRCCIRHNDPTRNWSVGRRH